MAKNKVTLKRLQSLVIKHNQAVYDEQNAYDLEGKTEAQKARAEEKAIDKQFEIADKIECLEMSQREIKEHSSNCQIIAAYFN